MSESLKILIGVPGSSWEADFGISLLQMSGLTMATTPHQLAIQSSKGSLLPQLRSNIVKKGLEMNADWLLFLDTDQTFPPYLLTELLAAGKDIIGCNIATKKLPSNPTARLYEEGNLSGIPLTEPTSRIQKVWRLGTGIMLINMIVFRQTKAPWFPVTWEEESQTYIGEDWNFCQKAEEAGFSIWVDNGISAEVGHIGKLEYDLSMIERSENEEKSAIIMP